MSPRPSARPIFRLALLTLAISFHCAAQDVRLPPRNIGAVVPPMAAPTVPLSPGSWSQLDKLVVKGFTQSLGESVSVSGNTVVAGTDPVRDQAAYVFLGSSSGWHNSLPVATLAFPPGSTDRFYSFVAIDGDTVVIGCPAFENIGGGFAYVFVKPATGWTDMFPVATLSPSGNNDGGFGTSVSISGDTIVVGDGDAGTRGAAYVFVKPAGGWSNMTETAKLVSSDSSVRDGFGGPVSISGPTVAVGASGFSTNTGKVYVFVEPAGGWTDMIQTAELTASDGAEGASFGSSISVSGNNILVGAPSGGSFTNLLGKAYIFTQPPSGWTNMTQTAELTSLDVHPYDSFGRSVSLSGNLAAVGAPLRGPLPNSDEGGIYIFEEPSGGWHDLTSSTVLTASDAHHSADFAGSVSLSGKIVVGGSNYFLNAAYVYGLP